MTKAEKRKLKKKDRGIVDFIKVVKHLFKNLNQWIEGMTDPRHSSYSIYTQNDLILIGVMKNVCSIESMRQMDDRLSPV